jgi:hypothetical protein
MQMSHFWSSAAMQFQKLHFLEGAKLLLLVIVEALSTLLS